MIAAGTQATDGRLCSPLTMGPIAARSHRLHHMARPRAVPTTSDIAKPTAPRHRLGPGGRVAAESSASRPASIARVSDSDDSAARFPLGVVLVAMTADLPVQ